MHGLLSSASIDLPMKFIEPRIGRQSAGFDGKNFREHFRHGFVDFSECVGISGCERIKAPTVYTLYVFSGFGGSWRELCIASFRGFRHCLDEIGCEAGLAIVQMFCERIAHSFGGGRVHRIVFVLDFGEDPLRSAFHVEAPSVPGVSPAGHGAEDILMERSDRVLKRFLRLPNFFLLKPIMRRNVLKSGIHQRRERIYAIPIRVVLCLSATSSNCIH